MIHKINPIGIAVSSLAEQELPAKKLSALLVKRVAVD
jgi:hypothetical protein